MGIAHETHNDHKDIKDNSDNKDKIKSKIGFTTSVQLDRTYLFKNLLQLQPLL